MVGRNYKTAYIISKFGEIMSWAVIVAGVIIGLSIMKSFGMSVGVLVMLIIGIPGFFLVFISQLTPIFIDTENNSRQVMSEIQKTNLMLAETLGKMANNLDELVKKGGVGK